MAIWAFSLPVCAVSQEEWQVETAEGRLDKESRLTSSVVLHKILNLSEFQFFYPVVAQTFIKPVLF